MVGIIVFAIWLRLLLIGLDLLVGFGLCVCLLVGVADLFMALIFG